MFFQPKLANLKKETYKKGSDTIPKASMIIVIIICGIQV